MKFLRHLNSSKFCMTSKNDFLKLIAPNLHILFNFVQLAILLRQLSKAQLFELNIPKDFLSDIYYL